jgi:nicotinate-nucleotide pyrophosphorylase (carboxylating)
VTGPGTGSGTTRHRHGAGRRLSAGTAADLRTAGLDPQEVQRIVTAALAEDLRYGPDVTTEATVPAGAVAVAEITPRTPGVLAGAPVARAVFDAVLGGGYEVLAASGDGSELTAGRPAMIVRGPVRGLLTAERTALNFLCHLSGIATVTARWVAAVAGTGAVVRDSRKTLPGLRELEKHAVRSGGGSNHRMGLGDSVLIKDNHIEAAGSVTAAMAAVRAHAAGLHCEVEVDDLEQLAEALCAGAAEVLLDNFTPGQCAQAVAMAREAGTGARLEASGGLTLETARAYAETGVDYLAVGALTHSAPFLDLGMDLTAPGKLSRGRQMSLSFGNGLSSCPARVRRHHRPALTDLLRARDRAAARRRGAEAGTHVLLRRAFGADGGGRQRRGGRDLL